MKKLIAGNWKMNLDAGVAEALALRLKNEVGDADNADVLICPSFVFLQGVKKVIEDSPIMLGAQDCSPEEKGAFTGDTAALMLKSVGCEHVIIGHSERRQGHGETSTLVQAKANAALKAGLTTIICIGETLEERKHGKAKTVIEEKIKKPWPKNGSEKNVVIAYDPVGAIGTGKTASPEDIADMHGFIREKIEGLASDPGNVRILYGGSVKPENAKAILATPNVNGALVGGASLKPEQFTAIIKAAG